MAHEERQIVGDEWVTFPGGELEGRRPKALCRACRDVLTHEATSTRSARGTGLAHPSRPLCFQCYRADLDRQRAIALAGQVDTGSIERFQYQLPLAPVNHSRLEGLKAARAEARMASVHGIGAYIDKRRHAQIAARHALQAIGVELRRRGVSPAVGSDAMADAIHAAELQLPEAWLPFVVAR